jgi:hypothetical protein
MLRASERAEFCPRRNSVLSDEISVSQHSEGVILNAVNLQDLGYRLVTRARD